MGFRFVVSSGVVGEGWEWGWGVRMLVIIVFREMRFWVLGLGMGFFCEVALVVYIMWFFSLKFFIS